jgi:hypothetical protein
VGKTLDADSDLTELPPDIVPLSTSGLTGDSRPIKVSVRVFLSLSGEVTMSPYFHEHH